MPRSRRVQMASAARVTAAPAITPPEPRPARHPEPGVGLTSLLGDLTPDPAAGAKSRVDRVGRLLWWTHRRLEYAAAVEAAGEGAPGLPPLVTGDDVARACGLGPDQRAVVDLARPGDPEPAVLRRVAAAVDAG